MCFAIHPGGIGAIRLLHTGAERRLRKKPVHPGKQCRDDH